MHYVVLRLRDVRMAIVLVEKSQMDGAAGGELLTKLQFQLKLPVMLVSHTDGRWENARARADFNVAPFLFALMALDEVDWKELPKPEEPDLPF
ncbi:hypothetical protein [Pseudoduganella chitinolytica]|uniref:Response regulatory domain-containing protein n=1 Tax=Pseudoduganella chitinolytica TaxID=34070 RepID=A0ABY8BG30_9BURK|nr:hypothetical protein [Pseudoduganella chitinolytica]WEF34892.1 hypothetical protein PX653_09070 [Pseudoduganella chitinolytica]